ncbi:MAG: 3,4-dihydroxy-2-butanone 4-phosphate synthase [Gammaproteobacteria bacterium]|nr:MAG: 3,4-dihydroxy-2-butanone 4-phosphate synthase [Gammaproteobacteria bacterium]
MPLNRIEELIEALRRGEMVIVMDDEGRENEGDLVMAAQCVTPEAVNFMTKHARGLICLTLTREHCERLKLPLLPKYGRAAHSTNFTVSIEAAQGVTTGISAADRATTILTAARPDAKPSDLVQPGHIFPVMAEDGGVLVRAGHTEAGCDLARLAGFDPPAAVIVEILNEDGTMARRADLEAFAARHGLKIGTIEDLIRYRVTNEKTVRRCEQCRFTSRYGEFELIAYHDDVHRVSHLALVKGPIDPARVTRVRVHVENPLQDLFGAIPCSGWPIEDALARIAEAEQGVLVYLTQPHAGMTLRDRVREYQHLVESGGRAAPGPADFRSHGVGAQILADLGVRRMEVLSAPRTFHGLGAFGLEVVGYLADGSSDEKESTSKS